MVVDQRRGKATVAVGLGCKAGVRARLRLSTHGRNLVDGIGAIDDSVVTKSVLPQLPQHAVGRGRRAGCGLRDVFNEVDDVELRFREESFFNKGPNEVADVTLDTSELL